ncbi:MAG: response regulator [Sphingobacteriales bacterium]|jgi:CheY-like chemotaxis protein|nr:response regulator [Sphingobacteriales bacterium]
MKVLIIEDESSIRDNIVEMFELKGIDVGAAQNGEDALEVIKSFTPNIVLCDLMMPVMNGFEFIEKFKSNPAFTETPVIFVSARAEVSEREKAMDAGASDFITKPFTFQEIFEKLAKHYQAE